MIYENIKQAVFLDRPNRFIAHILLHGEEKICHVKNTGRCKELLIPGCEIYVQEFPHAMENTHGRRTAYDLIAVRKGERLINMDSLAPNKVAAELLPSLFQDLRSFRSEQTYGNSRFDLAGEYEENGSLRRFFLEVKGVTLEQNGTVLFPDAPTQRGCKHLEELAKAAADGYDAFLLFLVQMENVSCFQPNRATDPAFADALIRAAAAGVKILAYDCHVTPDRITAKQRVPVRLNKS